MRMKTVILFLLILSNLLAITAEDAAWLIDAQRDVDKAYAKAHKEQKSMILVVVVKDGCSWCERMVHDTLKDADVQDQLFDTVTVVRAYGEPLPEGLEVTSTPTMFFLDAKSRRMILKQVGYIQKGSFIIDIATASSELSED